MKLGAAVLIWIAFAFAPLGAQSATSGNAACDGTPAALRREVEAVNAAMVAALESDPVTVARYYTDDATIMGGGMRAVGRAEIERYWGGGAGVQEWTLEVIEVGGSCDSVWQRGLSTLVGQSGRRMVTEFVAVMKRDAAGQLKYFIDIYVAAAAGA